MFTSNAGKEHVRRAAVCFQVGRCVLVLAILSGLVGTSAADCNPAGTWNGTWEGSGDSGTITNLVLTCDANVTGRRKIDLRPELPCAPNFEFSSTYTFNASECEISFQWTAETPCGDYNVVYAEDVVGVITDCDTAEGTFEGTISVYYGESLVGTGYIEGWWNVNRATRPVRATAPSPGHLAKYEAVDVCLSWTNCGGCTFDVYFGTDPTPDSSEFRGNQEEMSYCPGTLSYSTTYYWRIDARNTRGVTTGYVWRFTTEGPPNPIISGYVEDFVGSGVSGVTMEGWPASDPVTDSNGHYSGAVPPGWSGTITPSKAGYAFSPLNRSYSNVTSDRSNEDYLGAAGPISLIEIAMGLDYGEPDLVGDLRYEFFFGMGTGGTVSLVEVDTPGGIIFEIPNDVNTQAGEIQTWHYADGGIHYWGYEGAFTDSNALADYGEGTYRITVHHQDDSNDQTSVEYGIATWQPEQEPVLTSPEHNGSTRSPVTFEWEECTDIDATSIRLSLANEGANEWKDISFDVDVTDSGPVVLGEGMWEAQLWFEDVCEYSDIYDFVFVEGKYSKSDYAFNVTLSPLGHWAMDDDEPDTTVVDSSGYGNHGTAQQNTSVMRTEGMIDGALAFDGTNDYVDCGSDASLDVSGGVSISAWVKFDGLSDHQTIVAKRGAAGDKRANYALRTGTSSHASEDELQFYYHDGTGWHVYTTLNANLTAGQWYHFVSTFTFGTGTSMKCYVNNNLLIGSWTIGNGSSPVQINTQPVTIGGLTGGEKTAGLIDEVMIFDEALSAEEISALFNDGVGLTLDLYIDEMWMYQSLPGQSNSYLTADVWVIDDPAGNISYSYAWEIILPGDVNLAPVTVAGGGTEDAYWTFAARGCDEPGGLSDSGQTFTVRVTVTGDDYGNTGQAEAGFGIALLGDVNNDGIVNIVDRSIVNVFWRMGSAGPYTLRDCDVTSDGIVNVVDRSIANAVWRGMTGQNSVSSPCPLR